MAIKQVDFLEEIETCPICGEKCSGIYRKWVLNAQKKKYYPYYYCAHRVKKEGKWKLKWCYVPKKLAETILSSSSHELPSSPSPDIPLEAQS